MQYHTISLEVGKVDLSEQEIADLEINSVVKLDKKMDDPLTLILNEKIIAKCEVIIIDGNFGFRIKEVIQTE